MVRCKGQRITTIITVTLWIPILVMLVKLVWEGSPTCNNDLSYDSQYYVTDEYYDTTETQITFMNTYKLTIICLAFNRSTPLKRLLDSLNQADYLQDKVTLTVWIDRYKNQTYDEKTVKTAENYIFQHGDYSVNIHDKHVGLHGQWLTTYTPDESGVSEIVVFFEDDMTVSPHFYKYLKLVHNKYDSRPEISGYSLQGARKKLLKGLFGTIGPPVDQPVFKFPGFGTWGFSPNIPNWQKFLLWYNKASKNESFIPYPPKYRSSWWYKKLVMRNATESMWSIWHTYYAWMMKEYTIFCNFPNHQGLSTHWHEDGQNYVGVAGKNLTPLLKEWTLTYDMLPDNPVVLDIAGDVIQPAS
ncbi:hypothetical protein ACF0H5_012845 [Mactra antiquata]